MTTVQRCQASAHAGFRVERPRSFDVLTSASIPGLMVKARRYVSVSRPTRDYFLTVFDRLVRWELAIRARVILICCSSMSSGS
jgi:hypothetical protein